MICPQCQTENDASRTSCISCGYLFNATEEVPKVIETDEDTIMSENPNIENNFDDTKMLEVDASEVDDNKPVAEDDITYATAKMPDMDDEDGLLHIGSVRFRGNLILRDKEKGTVYRIENEQLNEAVIGRLNAQTGYRPHVDFTAEEGKERGVSRRHATINQRGDLIFVTDHNSLNGTFLNGQQLVPEQARVMRDSDSLRIGHISLIVIFEELSE